MPQTRFRARFGYWRCLHLSLVVAASLVPLSGQDPTDGNETLFSRAPSDWRAETFPFPLEFAPDIDLEGVEELRFAPGMLQADSENYFSYSFIWWLNGRVATDHRMLRENLLLYYGGLYRAVSKQETKDTSSFAVQIRATREPSWVAGAAQSYRGSVSWIDPFVTEKPLTLNLMIAQWYCEKKDRTAVYFLVSPQTMDHPIWTALRGMQAGPCE